MHTFWPGLAYKLSEDGQELTLSKNGETVTYKLLDDKNKEFTKTTSDGKEITFNNSAASKVKNQNSVWREKDQWYFKFYDIANDPKTFTFFNDYVMIKTLNDGKYMWKENAYFEYDDKTMSIKGIGYNGFTEAANDRKDRINKELSDGMQDVMNSRRVDTEPSDDDDTTDDKPWSD